MAKQERAFTIEVSCGMIGMSTDTFIEEIGSKTENELLFITNEVNVFRSRLYEEMMKRGLVGDINE